MKPFCYKIKKSRQKLRRAFEVKLKAFFIIFKGLSVAKICLRPENAPLSTYELIGAALK